MDWIATVNSEFVSESGAVSSATFLLVLHISSSTRRFYIHSQNRGLLVVEMYSPMIQQLGLLASEEQEIRPIRKEVGT